MNDTINSQGIMTQRCTLHFSDGQSVSALIRARGPHDDCKIAYAGAVTRLPYQFESGHCMLLRVLFRSLAKELNARFEEQVEGISSDELFNNGTQFHPLDTEMQLSHCSLQGNEERSHRRRRQRVRQGQKKSTVSRRR